MGLLILLRRLNCGYRDSRGDRGEGACQAKGLEQQRRKAEELRLKRKAEEKELVGWRRSFVVNKTNLLIVAGYARA